MSDKGQFFLKSAIEGKLELIQCMNFVTDAAEDLHVLVSVCPISVN